jgi:hypothetical protein
LSEDLKLFLIVFDSEPILACLKVVKAPLHVLLMGECDKRQNWALHSPVVLLNKLVDLDLLLLNHGLIVVLNSLASLH